MRAHVGWGKVAAVALVAAAVLTGCAAERPVGTEPASAAPTPTATPTPTPADPIAGLDLDERVGQLFMVGTSVDGADPTTLAAVADQRVAGIFLHGRSSAGAGATAALVAQFTAVHDSASPRLWVATDQEGGDVQVLSGDGFEKMPTALTSAQRDDATLRADAARWGAQLRAAGIDMNLAPVADIVTSPETARDNKPIGIYNREYGFDEATVAAKSGAFAQGMRDAGVLPTLKHFPGLGRVTGNTDYAADVVDGQVGADSPDVSVYRTLLPQGPAVVMMSTAVYDRIDPSAPAAFSAPVVTGLLRGDLGFDGVVMTDDLSAPEQVARWSPGERATLAVDAGVDLLLVSADASVFPEMYEAVRSRAESDPAFAEKVDDAARRVVELKADFP
ncbi:glycoside hydrolase family 3 protein [Microbacterium sp. cx-55]|uniref:glycoside hydrolase family 3 N-terminal domain-containing protein n=1 Tax=Microbacterium sp. cx-55 TaxID=2875948 RepID=UPI001CBDDCD8|nr:glycoside hydrolase family 3 N-terminal domain-containing protein [Microbacterium sp. cx-55]MBZ4487391.1 glycoside hydrolase family 3 protein [Microbacterium sp. cx-55]UGB35411.1 glycoside hydrolase family 3 protein [Microbacterium sp. cx-55]